MITATKNGINRNFSDNQWKNMPKDKYGWKQTSVINETNTAPIPEELILKKKVAIADPKPSEIIKQEVPEELISKPKKNDISGKKSKNE